jgi:Ca-activated chloride channel family protein
MLPRFAEPIWLLAGLLTVGVLGTLFLFAERRARARLHQFAQAGLATRLIASYSRRRLWTKNALALLVVLLLSASLARPQWGADWEESEARGIDIMIGLDTSRSMLAEDISPNRLERSKLAILDLLESVRGDRVGLIAFAGNAFLQCPLTLDYQAFRQTLAALDTETIPVGGTDVASAIDEAEAYFEKSGNERILVLITDGEDLEASGVERARRANQSGTRILTVGVGSPEGELIPIRTPGGQRDFLRDASGNPVSTALDESTLRRIAEASDGLYAPLGPTGEGLQQVYDFSLARADESERREMLQRIPIERYQWPLAAALAFLILESFLTIRRRERGRATPSGGPILVFLATFLLLPSPSPAGPAKEAARAYQEGRYEESVTLYREALEEDAENARLHYNLGVSAYRAGSHETAISQFEQAVRTASGTDLQRKAFFNAGNSRVAAGFDSLGDQPALTRDLWQAAIRDYENALELDPGYPAALQNQSRLRETIDAHTHAYTTTAEPAEGGSVTPGGEAFHRVPITLEARPAEGWTFDRWSGEGIEEPEKPRTVLRLQSDAGITARFAKTWNLEVVSEDPAMGTAGESGTFRADEEVPLKAEAEDYFAFDGWSSDDPVTIADPETAETTATLQGDATVTASFVPAFKLSVMVNPEIGGQAGPSGFFEEYSVVPIQAVPRPGFEWRGWTGDGIKDPEAAETTIALTGDRIAIAGMERIWNLVVIPVPEEGGTTEGAGDHPVGSTVDLTASPAEGFRFEGWEGPGVADPAAPETSVTVASSEHTVFARFARDEQDDQENQQDDSSSQDQQQDQNQQQQQDSSNQEQDQQENPREPDQQEPSPESQDSDSGREQDGEEQPEPESGESEEPEPAPQPEPGPEQANEQAAPGEMTREEARQLLQTLSGNERFLPAGERSREDDSSQPPESGRNW